MKKALYMLARFSDRDFDWLITAGKRQDVPAGTILIYEGQATDALYIILQGSLSVMVEALDGKIVAELSYGEVVGEMSFIDARLPSATVKANEDSLVWSIPRSKLAGKLLQDVSFAANFYHAVAVSLSDRLRSTVTRLSYSKDHPSSEGEADINPAIIDSLELAQARLNWLLNRLKETP